MVFFQRSHGTAGDQGVAVNAHEAVFKPVLQLVQGRLQQVGACRGANRHVFQLCFEIQHVRQRHPLGTTALLNQQEIFKQIGIDYADKIVRPVTRTRIRDNAVYYDAVALYSTKRNEFQQRIFKTIEADFKSRGLVLEQLLIRNINLPTSVKTTIESKINAEQEAQKMTFVLQKEKQEAERKRVEAQGIADYQRIISTGLSDKQLQYEQIKAQKELAASPNTKIIFMNGKGSAPVILSDK